MRKDQETAFADDSNKLYFKRLGLDKDRMYQALLDKNPDFEGVFFIAVKTTGIVCRPTCTAKKPKPENILFYGELRQALLDGYRPCKICKPLEPVGETPLQIRELIAGFHEKPGERLKDGDLRKKGIEPATVRRWFQKNHGMSFHAYQRMYRLNHAFAKISSGESVTDTALDCGYDSLSGFNDMFKKITGFNPGKAKDLEVIYIGRIETPLGQMLCCSSQKGICLLEFSDRRMLATELKSLVKNNKQTVVPGSNSFMEKLREELSEYFSGKRQKFTVPLEIQGTDFQKRVWAELMKIPYGETRSYLEQATLCEKPEGVRAVANANGMNRLAILIPCHRVIGRNGELRGYGGGVWRKKRLIELEKNFR